MSRIVMPRRGVVAPPPPPMQVEPEVPTEVESEVPEVEATASDEDIAAQGDPGALEELTPEDQLAADEVVLDQAVEDMHEAQSTANAAGPSRVRRTLKLKTVETVLALSAKVVDLVKFLEQNPDNEPIAEELRQANAALERALKGLDAAPEDLGEKKRKTEIKMGDSVEIVPKHKPRFTFLKGVEDETFTVESKNGGRLGVKSASGTVLYIAAGQLRLVAST